MYAFLRLYYLVYIMDNLNTIWKFLAALAVTVGLAVATIIWVLNLGLGNIG